MAHFSQRLSNNATPNSIAKRIAARTAQGATLLDLTESNPTRALQNYPHRQIADALGSLADLTYQPDARGSLRAREAIAAYYAEREIPVDPGQVLVTASTSEAYTFLFNLLCQPGEAVLSPVPSYPLFEHLAALSTVTIKPYRLLYDGAWHIDLDHLRRQIDGSVRAIVVVNPNNPTGHFTQKREAEILASIATEFDLAIISDEVFLDYPLAQNKGRYSSMIGAPAQVFALNGLSKSAGMPQMKLAWTVISGDPEFRHHAMGQLELISDTYLSVATPVQAVLDRLLRIGVDVRTSIRKQVSANWNYLIKTLEGSKANACHLEAGWNAIIRLPATRSEESWVLRLLDRQDVVAQPGFFFDMAGGSHIVVSLLTSPETFEAGTRGLREELTQG